MVVAGAEAGVAGRLTGGAEDIVVADTGGGAGWAVADTVEAGWLARRA